MLKKLVINNYDAKEKTGRNVSLTIPNTEEINTKTNIKIPDKVLNYGDGINNFNPQAINNSYEDQYLVTSTSSINESINTNYDEYYLSYNKLENSVKWTGNQFSKSLNEIEDFETKVLLNKTIYEWISLHSCLHNINNQIAWNLAKEYQPLNCNSIIYVELEDIDETLRFKISYLLKNSETLIIKEDIKVISLGDNFVLSEDLLAPLKICKIVSIEANKNVSDISFYVSNKTQEFISKSNCKSNTIKYALGKKEKLILKNLEITGSVESNILVKLIHLKDIFSENAKKITLKEILYLSRNNINENHTLNILIDNENKKIGNEIYIELENLNLKGNNTLSFSLQAIKFTDL